MRAVHFEGEDAALHLACDEVMLRHAEADRIGECLRIYEVTSPALVLGVACRWQGDARVEACREAGVPILRRASGGGAVLLADGCLNYSLILDTESRPELRGVRESYRWILGRLIGALAARGLHCGQAGLSDLTWNGRKVGGSAQKRLRRMLLHHGTLLYAFDVDRVERFLREPGSSPDYRAGRRHTDFIADLPLDQADVARAVRDAFSVQPGAREEDLSRDLADEVDALVRAKYGSEAWNLRR